MPLLIKFLGFKINAQDNAASVSFGTTLKLDTFLTYKRNYGFGEENGDITNVVLPVGLVNDQDVNDSNAIKGSLA